MHIEQLWLETETKLRQYLYKQVKDHSVVDDLLQNSFLKMQANIHQLKDIDKAGGWLFQITRSTLMDHFRKEKNLQKNNKILPIMDQASTSNETHEALAYWLKGALDLLPEPYREAVYLSEIKGMSQKELAKHLGISYSGAKSRVQRGKVKLKEIVLDCCEVAADRYGNVMEIKKR
ncbi:MAG: RNA polymerase sigma factor SigZ [Saprospiraceae bacterium]